MLMYTLRGIAAKGVANVLKPKQETCPPFHENVPS